jgi:hypothetical protein
MKRPIKTSLTIIGVAVLICSAGFFCIYILPILNTFHEWRQQMLAGQKYMDSLTERDFQIWTERTQKYLSNFNPTNRVIATETVPPDLAKLKILRIDENSN